MSIALEPNTAWPRVQISGLPSPVGFAQMLTQYDAREPTYAGCMKSGQVITDWKSPWYEPQNFKFGTNGGDHQYMLHAAATGYVISRPVALHLSRYSNILMVRPPPSAHLVHNQI